MLAEGELTTKALLLVVVLVRPPKLTADVEGVAALGPKPVIHDRDTKLAIDGGAASSITAVAWLTAEIDLRRNVALSHYRGAVPC